MEGEILVAYTRSFDITSDNALSADWAGRSLEGEEGRRRVGFFFGDTGCALRGESLGVAEARGRRDRGGVWDEKVLIGGGGVRDAWEWVRRRPEVNYTISYISRGKKTGTYQGTIACTGSQTTS